MIAFDKLAILLPLILAPLLALLSLNEVLRKRTETDVAFTREYIWDIESKER